MTDDQIGKLVKDIVASLVDSPDNIKLNVISTASARILEVEVCKEDIGKVIGREGKTADAIRTIVYAISGKTKTRTVLNIIDTTK